MKKTFTLISTVLVVVSLTWLGSPSAAQAEDQQAGQELVFPNVDQVRNRPSDVHIGSDPYYKPGMEQQMQGTDTKGYKKPKVEGDKEYYEQNTTYKRLDGKPADSDLAPENTTPKRWE